MKKIQKFCYPKMYALNPSSGDAKWSNPRTPVRGFAGGVTQFLINAIRIISEILLHAESRKQKTFQNPAFSNKIACFRCQKCITIGDI